MNSLRFQYFLLFGSFAAVQPFLPLLLKERGMTEEQLGYAMGVAGWAIMLSPAVVTLLADVRFQPRRVVSGCYCVSAAAIATLAALDSFWGLTASILVYTLAVTAMLPLQDGVFFGFQKARNEAGVRASHYNKVRVWGTYGYMAILIALFYPLKWLSDLDLALGAALLCFGLGLANSFVLPQRGRRETAKRSKGLPTSKAAKALFGKANRAFSASMFLLLMASAAYHTMYPVYLTETLGLSRHWMGIVIMSGALVEVFCLHALSSIQKRWGLRWVMLGCIALTVARFGLMYAIPNLTVAIGTQIFHGAMICAMMVIPPVYINRLADESNRNSVQGVYTMLVIGTSRFVGTAIAGHVAGVSQRDVYLLCAVLACLAFGLSWRGFHPEREAAEVAV